MSRKGGELRSDRDHVCGHWLLVKELRGCRDVGNGLIEVGLVSIGRASVSVFLIIACWLALATIISLQLSFYKELCLHAFSVLQLPDS